MVRISAPFDSDQYPKAILLMGNDFDKDKCGQCHIPTEDWPWSTTLHRFGRPGVMFQGEVFCTDCKIWAWDENTGERVHSFSGELDPWPSEEQHAGMHRFLRNEANEQGKQSTNCMGCGQRLQPDDFRVDGEGAMTTLFRVVPLTSLAEEWVDEHVSTAGFQPDWPTLHVEHRYLADLVDGIEGAGLTVGRRIIAASAC